jgi:hypothetical protein
MRKGFLSECFLIFIKKTKFDGSVKKFEWARSYDIIKGLCVVGEMIVVLREEQP